MNKDSSVLSLSFMDVMTSGMGSLLLLFFIMVATQSSLDLSSSPSPSRASRDDITGESAVPGEQDLSPFAVLIQTDAGTELWKPDAKVTWESLGDASNWKRSHGLNYVMVHGLRTPAHDAELRVGPVPDNAENGTVRVDVFRKGKRTTKRALLPADIVNGMFRIWPVHGEEATP
jgi:hypothetical protein